MILENRKAVWAALLVAALAGAVALMLTWWVLRYGRGLGRVGP